MIAGLVRHILTTFGGVMVGKGWVDNAQLEAVAGGAAALVGIVWSFWAKKEDKGES
jgi:hypothetical protein